MSSHRSRLLRETVTRSPRARSVGHYQRVAVGTVCAAIVIVAVLVFLQPPPQPQLAGVGANSEKIASTPTIELPTVAAAAAAVELRTEIEQLSESMLERFPDLPQALHVVALMYADLQRFQEAAGLWRKCLDLSPTQPGPYLGLARVSMDMGEDRAAVEALRKAIATETANAEVFHELSKALTKLGELDEAASASQRSVELAPDSAVAWEQLGVVQLQLNSYAAAEASLRKVFELGQSDPRLLLTLATACARQGKDAEAEKLRAEFAQHIAQTPQREFQTQYDAEMRRIAVTALTSAAAVYSRNGDEQHAERLLLRAIALDPVHAVACTELTVLYRQLGRIADAREVQQRLVDMNPLVAAHHLNLASLSSQLGDFETAKRSLQKVITIDPQLSLGYSGLAQLYLADGKWELARETARTALQKPSLSLAECIEVHWVLFRACEQLQDQAGADKAVANIRRLAPSDPRLRLQFGSPANSPRP